jgi:hypothetical protein
LQEEEEEQQQQQQQKDTKQDTVPSNIKYEEVKILTHIGLLQTASLCFFCLILFLKSALPSNTIHRVVHQVVNKFPELFIFTHVFWIPSESSTGHTILLIATWIISPGVWFQRDQSLKLGA